MKNIPKILLATPISNIKNYIIWHYFDWIKQLTYPNLDFLFVDNSRDENFHKEVTRRTGFECLYLPPEKDESIRVFMCRCNNLIRDIFLKRKHDFLFSLECDLICALNTIEHLLSLHKKVVGLPYFIHHSYYSKILMMRYEDFGAERMLKNLSIDEGFLFFDGKVKETSQIGIGCLLIHKSILEKLEFRVELNEDSHADTYFHRDLKEKLNEKAYIDTRYIAFHYNGNWTKIYQNVGHN
ncbi:MAG: hypothetical protein ABIG64_09515 [Candidatus Omnitrophota bacterium]